MCPFFLDWLAPCGYKKPLFILGYYAKYLPPDNSKLI
jgi:hypothetical protein